MEHFALTNVGLSLPMAITYKRPEPVRTKMRHLIRRLHELAIATKCVMAHQFARNVQTQPPALQGGTPKPHLKLTNFSCTVHQPSSELQLELVHACARTRNPVNTRPDKSCAATRICYTYPPAVNWGWLVGRPIAAHGGRVQSQYLQIYLIRFGRKGRNRLNQAS